MKSTPKSCSCLHCRAGKRTNKGKTLRKADERSFRRKAKISLRKGEELILVAPIGNYYD